MLEDAQISLKKTQAALPKNQRQRLARMDGKERHEEEKKFLDKCVLSVLLLLLLLVLLLLVFLFLVAVVVFVADFAVVVRVGACVRCVRLATRNYNMKVEMRKVYVVGDPSRLDAKANPRCRGFAFE